MLYGVKARERAAGAPLFSNQPAPSASTAPVTDAELVDLARRGDREAFGELVARYQHAAFRAVLAVTANRADAEDVTQEAFVRAWERLRDFRGDATFKTWLLAIAWRGALSHHRSIGVRLRRLVSRRDEEPFDPPSGSRCADTRLADEELAAAVRRLVRTLPEKLRVPLLLAATGDYTFDEMARVLGIPAGTLKWRVAEARRRLRTKLAAMGH